MFFLLLYPLFLLVAVWLLTGMKSESGFGLGSGSGSPHSGNSLNKTKGLFGAAAETPNSDAEYVEKDAKGRYVRVLLHFIVFYF